MSGFMGMSARDLQDAHTLAYSLKEPQQMTKGANFAVNCSCGLSGRAQRHLSSPKPHVPTASCLTSPDTAAIAGCRYPSAQ